MDQGVYMLAGHNETLSRLYTNLAEFYKQGDHHKLPRRVHHYTTSDTGNCQVQATLRSYRDAVLTMLLCVGSRWLCGACSASL